MTSFALDPTILPTVPERKGTLFLRSNHMKYGRATLNSNWHADREAEPKDYDVCDSREKRDLLKATYTRIGNAEGSLPETTTQEAMNEVHKLKKDFESRDTHKTMVAYDNFYHSSTSHRQTGRPDVGCGSVLPQHQPEHGARHLETTHGTDYQYPFEWTPKPDELPQDKAPEVQYRHCLSEFTDTADHRRRGLNTWQDWGGTTRDYSSP